jgi:hypothetical protein
LVGERNSFIRLPNPPKPSTHPVESLLSDWPFGARRPLKNSLTFSQKPPPYSVGIKDDFTSPRTLTGRSKRNCFRLDQKLSGISIAGRPNLGTREEDPGVVVADSAAGGRRGGPKLSIVPGTFPALRANLSRFAVRLADRFTVTLSIDALPAYPASPSVRFPPDGIGCTPVRLTPYSIHCNIRTYTTFRCFPPHHREN